MTTKTKPAMKQDIDIEFENGKHVEFTIAAQVTAADAESGIARIKFTEAYVPKEVKDDSDGSSKGTGDGSAVSTKGA